MQWQGFAPSKTLLQLACNQQDLGQVQLESPQVLIESTKSGASTGATNWEKLLSHYILSRSPTDRQADRPVDPDKPAAQLPICQVRIVNGQIAISHQNQPAAQLENIQAQFDIGGTHAPLRVEASFNSTLQQEPGRAELVAELDSGSQAILGNRIAAILNTTNLSVACVQPWLPNSIQATGRLDSQVSLNADLSKQTIALTVERLGISDVQIAAPELIAEDRIHLRGMFCQGQFDLDANSVSAEQFRLDSDFGKLRIDGQVGFQQLVRLWREQRLPESAFQLDGELDLARLASGFPETIGLREGVNVESGLVKLDVNTRNNGPTRKLVFNLDAFQIKATHQNQPIVWRKPLRIAGTAAENNGQLELQNVICSSEFFSLNGNASPTTGKFSLEGDLERLAAQVDQLINLDEIELAGQMNGRFNWELDKDETTTGISTQPIKLGGQFVIGNPRIKFPGIAEWSEQRLRFDIHGRGQRLGDGTISIQSGRLVTRVAEETLVAELRSVVRDVSVWDRLELKCSVAGDLERLARQVRNFVELPEMQIAGKLTSDFLLTAASESVRINQLRFQAEGLQFVGMGVDVAEPNLIGGGNLFVDPATGHLKIVNGKLSGSALAANMTDLQIDPLTLKMEGQVAFQADAYRFSQWLDFCRPNDELVWTGIVNGQVQFTGSDESLAGQLDAKFTDLIFLQARPATAQPSTNGQVQPIATTPVQYDEAWRESSAHLESQFTFSSDLDTVRFRGLKLNSRLADIRANGSVTELGSRMMSNVSGNWNLNWNGINQVINSPDSKTAQFTGRGWRPFDLQGPLFETSEQWPDAWLSPGLSVKTSLAWKDANMLQIPLEASELEIDLRQSVAHVSSQSTGLVGRLMQLNPAIELNQAEPMVTLRPGPVMENLNLNARLTRDLVKFVAPIVADATSAQGQVSLSSGGASIPVFDPAKGSARGTFFLNDVTVGPGPLAQQLIPAIDQLVSLIDSNANSLSGRNTWFRMAPQEVPFVVQDGRVYHQGLRFQYKGVQIMTRGNVGLDQTMELTATIPISDAWIQKEPWLAGLQGQEILIPIRGTLTEPKIDRTAMNQATQTLLRRTANSALNRAVGDKVDEFGTQLNSKFGREVNRIQDQINQKFGGQAEDRIGKELFNGIDRLFNGRDKRDK